MLPKRPLLEHQKDALLLLHNGAILWGAVGSGKSQVAMAYYMEHEKPKDIYVITTAKKRDSFDWEGEALPYKIGTSKDATQQGVLTVDSWNNIGKYTDVQNAFFIFDEQRLVGSGAWVKAFIKIAKYNRWIMLSATPGDTWMDFVPVFIANGYYKNHSQFKKQHVVYSPFVKKYPKIDHYIGVSKLVRFRHEVLVEMPYFPQTTRIEEEVRVNYDQEKFNQVLNQRWNVYENRPIKDAGELFRLMRKVVNTDHSRLQAVRILLKKHPKLIVFYEFDYELEALRTLGKDLAVAEWNGHFHEQIPTEDHWLYLVQYMAGAEGWNCVATDAMCFYSLTYSFKLWHQAHGRIDRLNTPFKNLYYYVLKSNSKIDNAISMSLSKKRNFNEAQLAKIIWK
jgi:hypothetical protein